MNHLATLQTTKEPLLIRYQGLRSAAFRDYASPEYLGEFSGFLDQYKIPPAPTHPSFQTSENKNRRHLVQGSTQLILDFFSLITSRRC